MHKYSELDKYSKYNLSALGLLVLVLFSVVSFNYVVDPFNRNQAFDLDLPKSKISIRMHYPLYKSIEFSNNPTSTILLGDSRTDALKREFFADAGEYDIYNMAYGGGTLFEAIDSFWFAVEKTKLKKVFIGLPFNLYNNANNNNRFSEAEQISQSPWSYYLSLFVAKAGMLNVASKLSLANPTSEAPPMNREQFWDYQLNTITSIYYSGWKKPVVIEQRLKDIAKYCDEHNIGLAFFIPPTHLDLQNMVADYDLETEYQEYKKALARMATVIDFDYPNKLTKNADNFKDPYHFSNEIAPLIVKALLEDSPRDSDKPYYKILDSRVKNATPHQ